MGDKGFLTIGYGNRTFDQYINLLMEYKVNCIVDVRTNPKNSHNAAYNMSNIEKNLKECNINYVWLGKELGGRYDDPNVCMQDGTVDYFLVEKTKKFNEGISKLEKLIQNNNVCVMCSESDPVKCHRFLLISRHLRMYNIHHIISTGKCKSNKSLEEIILKEFEVMSRQISLLGESKVNLENAYKRFNLEYAYKSKTAKEKQNEKNNNTTKIFSIGFTKKDAETFFKLLTDNGVKTVYDVRLNNSNQLAGYTKEKDLKYFLGLHGIDYEYLSFLAPTEELKKEFVCKKPKITFEEYTKRFKQILEERKAIALLCSKDLDSVCFLCSEDKPDNCHRKIVIDELVKNIPMKNIVIKHLF